jgi:hypothetical protein
MSRVVFMLEEPSLKALLLEMLPRLMPGLEFLCITHEGKNDLEKSIPRKLRAWNTPGDRFVVVRDNDGGDCIALKERLHRICEDAGRGDVLIRIACQELEAWYLGDLQAVGEAFQIPGLPGLAAKARYRDPDRIAEPSAEIARLVPQFQKVSGARRIGAHLSTERNRSHSFQVFLSGLQALA